MRLILIDKFVKDIKMAEMIIVFREVLEASLIIGILYTYLKKNNNDYALSQLWKGVNLAIIASFIGSFLFQILAGGFQGQAEKIFEGVVMIIASITLTTMIIWMAQNHNIKQELTEKADQSIKNDNLGIGIFTLAFISVFREGIETILFLYGILMKEGNISIFLSLIGALLGIGVGYLIFIKGRKMPLKSFFNISSVLLIFVSSGMMAYGVHELESAGIIPYLTGDVESEGNRITATRLSGYTKVFEVSGDYESLERTEILTKSEKWASRIWDVNPKVKLDNTYPILHDKGLIGGLLKGLFGYNGDPSLLEFVVWLFYLVSMLYFYNIIRVKSRIK